MPPTLALIATASAVAQFILNLVGEADAAKSIGLLSPAIPGFASVTAKKRLEDHFHKAVQTYSESTDFTAQQRAGFRRVDEAAALLVTKLTPYMMRGHQAGEPHWVESQMKGTGYASLRRPFEDDGLEQALDWVVSATANHIALLARSSSSFAPDALLEMLRRLSDLESRMDAALNRSVDATAKPTDLASELMLSIERAPHPTELQPFRRSVNYGEPARAAFYKTREQVAAKLIAALDARSNATVLVTGKLGHGKSQSTRDALQTVMSRGRHWHFWVDASSVETLIDGYVGAARELELIGPHAADARLSARAFTTRLGETTGWVVVLDGVALAAEDLDAWLPRGAGTVIATSELDGAGALALRGKVDKVRVRAFTVPESLSYLRARLGPSAKLRGNGSQPLIRLARELDHNPAAMSIAAAMLGGPRGMTAAEFVDRLERSQAPLDAVFSSDASNAKALLDFWRLAVESAHQVDETALAKPLIDVMSLLDSSFIPDSVLTAPTMIAHFAQEVGKEQIKKSYIHASLNGLDRQEMVRSAKRDGVKGWSSSPLMMRGLRDTLTAGAGAKAIRATADAIMEVWSVPTLEAAHTSTLRTNAAWLVLGHPGLGAGARVNRELTDTGCHPLVFTLLDEFADNGDAAGAHEAYKAMLASIPTEGKGLLDSLAIRLKLADLRAETGDSEGAIDDLRNLVSYIGAADVERYEGDCDSIHFRARYTLGRRLAKADKTREALGLFEALLGEYGRNCKGSNDIFRCRYQAARAKAQLGRISTALEELNVLYIEQQLAGTVPTRHVLKTRAEIYRWVGHSGEAALAHSELESMRQECQQIFGSDSKEMLALRRKIAYWRGKRGDSHGAALDFHELVIDCIRILGPRHRDTLTARRNAAYWLGKAGMWSEGARQSEIVHLDAEKALGADHPQTLVAWRTHAVMVGDAGDPVSAARELDGALGAMREHMSVDSPQAVDCQRFYADWLGNSGSPKAAAEKHRSLMFELGEALGESNPRTLLAKKNYGKWLTRSGRPTTARQIFRELIEQIVGVHGLLQPETLSALEWQAEAIGVAGNALSASKRFLHVAEVLGHSIGDTHPEVLLAWNGHYYWMTKVSPDDAEAAIERLAELGNVVDRVLGSDSVTALTVHSNHAYALGKAGDHAGAVDAFSDVLSNARVVLAATNPELLVLRSNAARFLMREKPQAAIDELEQVVRQMRRTGTDQLFVGSLESGHPQYLTARRRLACAYRASGDIGRALALISEVIAEQDRALEPEHPQALRAVRIQQQWLAE